MVICYFCFALKTAPYMYLASMTKRKSPNIILFFNDNNDDGDDNDDDDDDNDSDNGLLTAYLSIIAVRLILKQEAQRPFNWVVLLF